MSPRASRRELALAFAIPCLLAALFCTKAAHQDDWAYLRVSRYLLDDPPTALEQTTLYQGTPISAAQGVLHGPVWLVVLGAIQAALPGPGLVAAHLAAALAVGLLGLASASLAGRLGARALPAGLALALGPIVLPVGTTLMTDVPMLALFLGALALFARGLEDRSRPALAAAGALGLLAALTRYHGLAILPLLAIGPLVWPAGYALGLARWLPAAIVLLGFGGYSLVTRAAFGQVDMVRATDALGMLAEIDNGECLLAAVAALGALALPWALGALVAPAAGLRALRAPRGPFASALAFLAAGLCAGVGFAAWAASTRAAVQPSGLNLVLQWACLLLGGVALALALAPWLAIAAAAALRANWRLARADHGRAAFAALVLLGFTVAAWWTVPFGCPRYALPALPGLVLLAARATAALPARSSWLAAALSAALGLASAEADRRAAEVNREIAGLVSERLRGDWQSGRTWIWGEIGFRHYLEEIAGLAPIASASNEPASGDRLLKSAVCTASPDDGQSGAYKLHPALVQRLRGGELREFPDAWPLRVHNPFAPAGLYMASAGFLPFAFSTAPHDRLQVWDVGGDNPFLARFDRATVERFGGPAAVPPKVSVDRFLAHPEQEMLMSVAMLYPGRVTWEGVRVPERARLEVQVAEHSRVWAFAEPEPGPGTRFTVRVDGEIVAERALDSRRNAADRGWHALAADLGRFAGATVALTFEAGALDAPAGTRADLASYVNAAFGEPRLASAP
jgi:hypothetical protein